MTQELAVQETKHFSNEVYIPTEQDWKFFLNWGFTALKSGMLPTSVKSPEAAAVIVLKGRELGISFMTAFAHIHIINGKPSMSAELLQSQAKKNLPGLKIVPIELSTEKAIVKFLRPEKDSEWFTSTFTMEDAKRAELVKNPSWTKYPKAMLWSRAVTAGLRIVCPEALNGVSYTPEELGAEVNEDGSVIETTGKRIPEEAPKTPDKPPVKAISAEQLAVGRKIKSLKLELGISDDQLKQVAHSMSLPSEFTEMNLEQASQLLQALENEKAAIDSAVAAPKQPDPDQDAFENFHS